MKVRWSEALKPNGRFSRAEFALFYFLLLLSTWIVFALVGPFESLLVIAYLWLVFQIFAAIIIGIRRLHDLNRSGWQIILAFVPGANIVMIIILFFMPGKVEENRWINNSELEEGK